MSPQIAFVGLGLMGQEITKNIVKYGGLAQPLILYNRTKSRAEEHSAAIGHSRVAESIEDAILQSDIIWSCLQNDLAVIETFDGVEKLDLKGKLFVESSTIEPGTTDALAKKILEAGAEFVAAPLMGEPTMVSRRVVLSLPTGAGESVSRIKPYLQEFIGPSVVDLSGEEPASGSLLKLLGNVVILTTMETVAEANVFAEKAGVGAENMGKFMDTLFPRPPHTVYNQRMLSGGYHKSQPMVEVSKAIELSSHVLELAKSCDASVKGYEVAVEHLKKAQTHAGPASDITGIYGAVRLESKLDFKRE